VSKTKLVIITGPTATGKTGLAVELAQRYGAEIVNADSMQVYRRFDIGTAKPTARELAAAPHHLISICEPCADYTAARFAADAAQKIEEIRGRGAVAIVAGGTGLYIKALTGGLLDAPSSDETLRAELLLMADELGREAVHARLKAVDPASAEAIHPNNLRRVMRAIELTALINRPVSEARSEHGFAEEPYDTLKIGLRMERVAMYAAIDARVERMMEAGLVDEVKGLLADYGPALKPMAGLGYKEIVGYLNGVYALDEAVSLIKMNTRRYAKRQVTWFKRDAEIKWFSTERKDAIIDAVKGFLKP